MYRLDFIDIAGNVVASGEPLECELSSEKMQGVFYFSHEPRRATLTYYIDGNETISTLINDSNNHRALDNAVVISKMCKLYDDNVLLLTGYVDLMTYANDAKQDTFTFMVYDVSAWANFDKKMLKYTGQKSIIELLDTILANLPVLHYYDFDTTPEAPFLLMYIKDNYPGYKIAFVTNPYLGIIIYKEQYSTYYGMTVAYELYMVADRDKTFYMESGVIDLAEFNTKFNLLGYLKYGGYYYYKAGTAVYVQNSYSTSYLKFDGTEVSSDVVLKAILLTNDLWIESDPDGTIHIREKNANSSYVASIQRNLISELTQKYVTIEEIPLDSFTGIVIEPGFVSFMNGYYGAKRRTVELNVEIWDPLHEKDIVLGGNVVIDGITYQIVELEQIYEGWKVIAWQNSNR